MLLLPLLLAGVLPLGLRLGLGAERAARFNGLAAPVAFLVGWGVIGRPGWLAYDATGRIAHIVLGATLLGLLLDVVALHRAVVLAASAVLLMICVWTELHGGFWPTQIPSAAQLLAFLVLSAIAIGMLWRVDMLRREEPPYLTANRATLITLIMMSVSLAAVAAAAHQPALRLAAVVLACALAGFLACTWILQDVTLPHVVVLPSIAAILAIAWAIGERVPRASAGLALSALILFVDGTVRRIPLPKAGISRILYPLLLGAVALAPLALAALVTFALHAS